MSTASLHVDPAKVAAKRITGIMDKHQSITGKNLKAIAGTIHGAMTRPDDLADTEDGQIKIIIGVLKWRLDQKVYRQTTTEDGQIELSYGCNAPRKKRGKAPKRQSGNRPAARVHAMA